MQWQVRDVRQTRVINADQTGEGMGCDQRRGLRAVAFELGRQVHVENGMNLGGNRPCTKQESPRVPWRDDAQPSQINGFWRFLHP